MFFANDTDGNRIHIDEAIVGQPLFCPACSGEMIQKRGDINTHHFAHKSKRECDSWYAGKMSLWHKKMQNHFDKSSQEIVVWNETHTEYHVADVVLQSDSTKYVVEFQHSTISQKEFFARSEFYRKCGYKVIWVFDFIEYRQSKMIYMAEECENGYTRLVWPGKDRIRFLDGFDFTVFENQLLIFFHINTGQGIKQLHSPDGYWSWETWEYADPFHRCPCFALLHLETFDKANDFLAKCFSEQLFFQKLKSLSK